MAVGRFYGYSCFLQSPDWNMWFDQFNCTFGCKGEAHGGKYRAPGPLPRLWRETLHGGEERLYEPSWVDACPTQLSSLRPLC